MKRFVIRHISLILTVLMILGVSGAFAQKRKPVLKKKPVVKKVLKPAEPLYTVAADTVIRVRMNSTITSKSARVGDTFTTTVTEPVYSSNGVVVVPVGSTVTGRVDTVAPAGKEGKPGSIDAHFVSLRLPNGKTRAINGSLTDLSGKTSSDNEGTAAGKKMGHRKVIFIGGGAATGAILGAAIGGGKGALIGGIIGGAGGFLGDRLTKGPDAEVKSGTEFGVWLNQSISLPRFAEGPVNP